MKIVVFNDRIISTSKDDRDITGIHPDCQIYYVPDDAPVRFVDDSGAPVLPRFSSLEMTREDSDRYETQKELKLTDTDMCRVIEDIIDLLIEKSGWQLTDLPDAVQEKLAARKARREAL